MVAPLPSLDEIIDRSPLSVTANTRLVEALQLLGGDRSILVTQAEKVVGICTPQDILPKLTTGSLEQLTLAEIARPVVSLKDTDYQDIFTVFGLLRQQQIGYLPVVNEQGQLRGLITPYTLCCGLPPSQLLNRSVSEIMTQPLGASPEVTVGEVVELMLSSGQHSIVITPLAEEPAGLITGHEIIQYRLQSSDLSMPAAAIAAPLPSLSPTDSLHVACQQMGQIRRSCCVVGDRGERLGIVTAEDILTVFDPMALYRAVETGLQPQIPVTTPTTAPLGEPVGDLQAITQLLRQEIDLRQQAESALAHEHKLVESVLNVAAALVVTVDAQGRIVYFNRTCEQTTDYRAEEVKGQYLWDALLTSEAVEPMKAAFRELDRGRFPAQIETEWVAKNGNHHLIAWSNTLIRDQGVKFIIGIGINITERQQVEAELEIHARQQAVVAQLGQQALAQTELEALIEEAVVLMAHTLDVEYARALELLPPKTELRLKAGFGWQEDSLLVSAERDSQVGFTLTSSQPVLIEDLRRETRFVVPSLLRKHGVISGVSVVVQGKDEPFGVLEVYATEQRSFSQDDVNFMQAIANVIATAIERQQIEEELNRFFNLSIDMFCIAGTDGYFKRINPRFEECLGYTQAELLSRSFLELVHLEDIQATLAELEKISLGLPTRQFENRYQHKDGSYRWLAWSMIPYGDLCCAVARDVTEQKRIEDALRNLATRISSANGEAFFQSLVLYLAEALDTNYAFVGEMFAEYRISTVAVCVDGEIAENFEYNLSGSPCEQVIRQGMCLYSEGVQQQFPQDELLVEMEAQSYLGIPLVNSSGQTLGLLAVLSRQPLKDTALIEEIIQIFAVRAGAELERRQAEANLRDSEQKFRQLAENIREVFFIVATKTRQFVYVSPAFEQIWGFSGKMLDKNPELWVDSVEAEDRDRLIQSLACERHGQGVKLEYRIRRSDGVRWIRMRTFPVFDASGQLYRVVGIAEDITERKHSDARLQESEEKFRATFEQAAVGIAHVAIDGQWLRVNQKLCDIVGYPREELLEKTYQDITYPDDLPKDINSVEQILTGAIQTNSFEKRYRRRDGSLVWINLTISLVRHPSGEPNYFISVIEDISDRKQAEEALKESERRYSSLVQVVPVGIFRTDAQGNYTYLNEQACELNGVCDIITEKLSEVVQSNWSPSQSVSLARQSWQKPPPFRCEYQFEQPNSKTIWVSMQTVPEINETGLVGYVGTISDISARKQAQQKLQQLNDQLEIRVMQRTAELQAATSRLSTLIETLQAGVVVQDELQLVVLINQGFCDIFKIPVVPPALIGSDFSEFAQEYQHHFADPVEFARRYQEILDHQQVVSREELQLADGRTFERDYVPIFMQNQYCGNLWMYRDITERKQAEAALQLSEARFRATFEQAAVGIIQTTIDGQFLRVNPKFCEIVGYSPAELLNKTLLDITYLKDWQQYQQQLQDLLTGQRASLSLEKRYLRQDEQIIWANLTSSLVSTTGEPDYLISVVEDISDRKRAEAEVLKTLQKEKELVDLKSRFVAMTSHEFRTPLAVISSSAGLLQDYGQRLVPEKKQKHFDRIQSSVKHMTQLLNDVLTVNQAEAYKLQFEPVSIELVSFCQGLVDELQASFAEHTLHFTPHLRQTRGQPNLPAYLDRKLLRQILSNLLSNAVKYSPQGGAVYLELIEDERAIFKIRDQGIGIPVEDQERLFESFHRAKNVGNIPGTGLGLMIVKKCVDLQQGKITIDSQVGVGTTVTLTLPLNRHQSD